MDEITLKALNTFTKNLKYLEEHHKPIFEKIALLNHLIDEGKYTEHYALEYKDEGYFDILEIETNEFLYKSNSLEAAQRMVDVIDFKRTGAIFKGQKYVYATEEQADRIDNSELSFHNSLWGTIKIINYVSKFAPAESFMNRVHKVIFLGIGLGCHLQGIAHKLNPQVLFIKEKNLETFRLSLFVTDYETLSFGRFLFFSLTDDEEEERENFIEFLNKGNNYNLHLKHIPFTLDYQQELQRLQTHVLSQSYINYGYSAMLFRFISSPKYLARGYSFLNVNKIYKDTVFTCKPVLLLFSGPSTSRNIEWVVANRDRFIVISALSTCRLLQKHNITPDVIIHIDPGENTSLLFEDLRDDYFKNATILLASNVDEATLQKFDRSQVHFIEQGTLYKKGFGRFSAPSVGEYAYGLSLLFGATEVFLLGIDLALDVETLQTHGDFHPFQLTAQHNEHSASLNPNESITYVKGNLIQQIPTLSAYKISIEQAAIFTKMLKRDDYHHIYNLSNGAYLEGCEPLHFKEYAWEALAPLNRTTIQEDIATFFKDAGSDEFNAEDREQLVYQVKEAKKLEKIIKQFQKKKFANAETYLKALTQLSWDISDMDYKTRSDLAQVYYEYFSIVTSYIFDLFNTKDLENPNKHVVQINAILMKQLLKMSSLYITKLEAYLK